MLKTKLLFWRIFILLLILPLAGCALYNLSNPPQVTAVTENSGGVPTYDAKMAVQPTPPPTQAATQQRTPRMTSTPYVVPTILPSFVLTIVPTRNSIAVSKVNMSVNNSSVTTTCPPGYAFTLYAQILTNRPGYVTYDWEFSTGSTTGQATIFVSNILTQTVTTTFNPGADGKFWARLRNKAGSNAEPFSRIYFTLSCPNSATNTPTLTPTPASTSLPTLTPTPNHAAGTPTPTSTSGLATPTPTNTTAPATPGSPSTSKGDGFQHRSSLETAIPTI